MGRHVRSGLERPCVLVSLSFADSGAEGAAVDSPGVVGGSVIQVPVHTPVSLCGDTIDAIGITNPAFGNVCQNLSHNAGW
ncbi:chaplin [Streptomyces sp. 4R-3d]|uniref:chaplin n=1 Tax=Streptomyces sp. 4R-3d TaxID=2559605 RepID=UPI001071ABE4|nr:chaplin [Streptomyces sp. 4R-3d]TFI27145.1 chaplin [Streptomyces sp. 4R-3d]